MDILFQKKYLPIVYIHGILRIDSTRRSIMSRIKKDYQLYKIKGYYQHQNYEDEFSFSGILLTNPEGMFEGVVHEKINEEGKTRSCYVVGDLFSERGISMVKMSNHGPKRKAYYYGFTTEANQNDFSIYGEWHYQKASLANHVVEYNPDSRKIKESSFDEDNIRYGGYFHFDMRKKSLSKLNLQQIQDGIDKLAMNLEKGLKEKRKEILYSQNKQDRRNFFFETIHSNPEGVQSFFEQLGKEMGGTEKVLQPYYLKGRNHK